MTGDPERIEAVLQRVDNLVLDFETVRFDPYIPSNKAEWRSVMSRFQREVKLIEEEANSFIDESFQSLRSAEGAFDMLHNFKHLRSRDAINAAMMKNFKEILVTFEKEVDAINDLFLEHRNQPPISKNQPPVAGAISWSRSLFQRIKHTVLRFQTMKELIDSEAGKAVSVGQQFGHLTVACFGATMLILYWSQQCRVAPQVHCSSSNCCNRIIVVDLYKCFIHALLPSYVLC